MTADDLAQTWHRHYMQTCDALQPPWDGLAVDIRRNRVATWQAMLDAGWTFTPPG